MLINNKIKLSYCILLIDILFFTSSRQVSGQGNLKISAGIGFPELANIGIKYKVFDQTQIGLCIGYGTVFEVRLRSFSGDLYYHFGGLSKYSDLRLWYGRIGLNYFVNRDYRKENYLISYLRIGRDFNLFKNFGINLDAGLGWVFHYSIKDVSDPSLNWIPAMSISLNCVL
jgi:hypothetical protein